MLLKIQNRHDGGTGVPPAFSDNQGCSCCGDDIKEPRAKAAPLSRPCQVMAKMAIRKGHTAGLA